ncbi:MAG TPA: NADH-quinone oxidoreductase subunit N, partial [Solirubrobacterales bacterium]
MNFNAPHIDYAALSPILALTAGLCVVLLSAVFKPFQRTAPLLILVTLGATAGLLIWQWNDPTDLIAGALRLDDLAISISLIAILTAACAVLLSIGEPATEQAGSGEYHALLLGSVLGMTLLAQATNLVTFFVAIETLSIPLYILCAANMGREKSLESGLKYLIVGSLGSATLLYGLAFVYGASGSTDFPGIASGMRGDVLGDPLLLVGIGLSLTGLAFKASVAPFHQWTPDVYQGAPTPVTTFMAVATKAAAFAILLRFFNVALLPAVDDWDTAMAALAAISIIVGNIGAIGQRSLKRMLAWSGVAQAGYILAGVVVASDLGTKSVVFYLMVYLFMNVAAFAVVIARERETPLGDSIAAIEGL